MHYQIYQFPGYLLVLLSVPEIFGVKIYPNMLFIYYSQNFQHFSHAKSCQIYSKLPFWVNHVQTLIQNCGFEVWTNASRFLKMGTAPHCSSELSQTNFSQFFLQQ